MSRADLLQRFFEVAQLPHDPFAKAFLGHCQSHTIKAGGKFHKYFQRGTGPSVLLVHGIYSNLGSMVTLAEALVEQHYRVVLFDAPAHGESLGTAADPMEVRELVRGLYGRLGELHAVVCHSLGALWALSAWSEDVRARTVVSISAPADARFPIEKFAELNQLDGDAVEELVRQMESRFGPDVWAELSPATLVRTIDVPGLVLHGTKDDYVPPEHAAQLHSNWRGSRMELVDGADHFDIVESPTVLQTISAHLRELT